MKKLQIFSFMFVVFGLCGCSFFAKEPVQSRKISYANEQERISLQNLTSRVIVNCYSTLGKTAEECAKHFEQRGFVRFRDIPYKTANYDFLKVDTYPTRRWRDSEISSRW